MPIKGFCADIPQPKIWDPSRLAVFAQCPRKHWYRTVLGLKKDDEESVHLRWGKAYHACVEAYDLGVLDGEPLAAQDLALEIAASSAIQHDLWGDEVVTWHCLDPEEVPAKRMRVWRHMETGEIVDAAVIRGVPANDVWELIPKMVKNRDRCPNHNDQLVVDRIPEVCECGAEIVQSTRFVPFNAAKTGATLVAAVKAYIESATSIKPYSFPDGTPGVEIQARLPLPFDTPDGDPYELLVNIDSLVEWDGEIAVRERKTTGRPLNFGYWAQFDPNVQIDTYDLVASVLYAGDDRPPKIMVETLKAGPAPVIERRVIPIPESRRAEWYGEVQLLILEAQSMAIEAAELALHGLRAEAAFPRRTTSCVQGFSVCPFLGLCQAGTGERGELIAQDYKVERWDPEDAESYMEEPA